MSEVRDLAEKAGQRFYDEKLDGLLAYATMGYRILRSDTKEAEAIRSMVRRALIDAFEIGFLYGYEAMSEIKSILETDR